MSNKIRTLKDPGSAITHLIALILACLSAVPLLIKAAQGSNHNQLFSFGVFIISMILLYGASTIYHSVRVNETKEKHLKKFDHAMIFVLIAGSYTPICMIVLSGRIGTWLLTIVWSVAIIGIIFKLFWVNCPKWLSSTMYIAMGWLCVLAFAPIIKNLQGAGFMWLLLGGIIYTVGGVIYAIKTPRVSAFNLRHKYFGSHEIFHVFVMLGSLCHFILVYSYLTK